MEASHLLLGRPWQYHTKADHNGYTNKISFKHQGHKIILKPLSPREVREDKRKLIDKISQERQERIQSEKKKSETLESEKLEEVRTEENESAKESQRIHCQEINLNSIDSKDLSLSSGFEIVLQRTIAIPSEPLAQKFSYKEVDLSSNDLSLSSGVETISQDRGLCELTTPLRIRNHISLVPSAPLATKPAFMSNPQEIEQGVDTLLSSSSYVTPNDSHAELHNNEETNMPSSCSSLVVIPCPSESDVLNSSKVDLHKNLSWHDFMDKEHKESHYFHYKQFASVKARECLTHNSKSAFVNFYLDEYGFLQSVWHMDGNILTIKFVEHEYLQGLLALTRFVFDPGGTKELNSRTNSLEEGGDDVILKGMTFYVFLFQFSFIFLVEFSYVFFYSGQETFKPKMKETHLSMAAMGCHCALFLVNKST